MDWPLLASSSHPFPWPAPAELASLTACYFSGLVHALPATITCLASNRLYHLHPPASSAPGLVLLLENSYRNFLQSASVCNYIFLSVSVLISISPPA